MPCSRPSGREKTGWKYVSNCEQFLVQWLFAWLLVFLTTKIPPKGLRAILYEIEVKTIRLLNTHSSSPCRYERRLQLLFGFYL